MTKIDQIQRLPLHSQVAGVLRDQIVGGDLKPLERLNEIALCESLGISRTPLREAMKLLELEGLVTIQPHKGAMVSEISLLDIEEIFDLLAPLEALGVRLAMKRMTEVERQQTVDLHNRMIACYRAEDREGCFQNDYTFHRNLIEFARHDVLKSTYTALTNRSQRGRYLAPRFSQSRLDNAMAAHEALIDAFKSDDQDAASEIMHQHVSKTGETVLETLRLGKIGV
ncbi:GntR family transcriptional regulator [Marivita sp.]|uniref:GntR family transcriptional regulator n=1 Tax=Marivita sp. TaxID=2003365 RepID=UPI003F715BF1